MSNFYKVNTLILNRQFLTATGSDLYLNGLLIGQNHYDSGAAAASGQILLTDINSLSGFTTGLSGFGNSNYATISNLFASGSNLYLDIVGFSGVFTGFTGNANIQNLTVYGGVTDKSILNTQVVFSNNGVLTGDSNLTWFGPSNPSLSLGTGGTGINSASITLLGAGGSQIGPSISLNRATSGFTFGGSASLGFAAGIIGATGGNDNDFIIYCTSGIGFYPGPNHSSYPALYLDTGENGYFAKNLIISGSEFLSGNLYMNGSVIISGNTGIVINGTTGQPLPTSFGTLLQLGNSASTQILIDTVGGGFGGVRFRTARGPAGSGVPLLQGDSIGALSFCGQAITGSNLINGNSSASMFVNITENWTPSANGTQIQFSVTPNQTTNPQKILILNQDLSAIFLKNIIIGTNAIITGSLTLSGQLLTTTGNNLYVNGAIVGSGVTGFDAFGSAQNTGQVLLVDINSLSGYSNSSFDPINSAANTGNILYDIISGTSGIYTAGVSGTAILNTTHGRVGFPLTTYTWQSALGTNTNMLASQQFLGQLSILATHFDLTNYTGIKLVVTMGTTASAATGALYIGYVATNYSSTAANYVNITQDNSYIGLNFSIGLRTSGWHPILPAARSGVFLACLISGGNGVITPNIGMVSMQLM